MTRKYIFFKVNIFSHVYLKTNYYLILYENYCGNMADVERMLEFNTDADPNFVFDTPDTQ